MSSYDSRVSLYASGTGEPGEPLASDGVDDEQTSPGPVGRIVTAFITLVLGGVYGTIGTVMHDQSVAVWGVAVPWGLVLSLIGLLALLSGLRLVLGERLYAFTAAVGAVGLVVVYSFESVGGSVLISQTLAGVVWLFSVPLVAALVIAFPNLSRVRARPGDDTPRA